MYSDYKSNTLGCFYYLDDQLNLAEHGTDDEAFELVFTDTVATLRDPKR